MKKGATVLLKTDDNVVEYIEILNAEQPDDKIITNYTGELAATGSGNPMTLTVRIEELTAIFKSGRRCGILLQRSQRNSK